MQWNNNRKVAKKRKVEQKDDEELPQNEDRMNLQINANSSSSASAPTSPAPPSSAATSSTMPALSWREAFVTRYRLTGGRSSLRYYAPLYAVWQKIHDWMDENAPPMAELLNPGMSMLEFHEKCNSVFMKPYKIPHRYAADERADNDDEQHQTHHAHDGNAHADAHDHREPEAEDEDEDADATRRNSDSGAGGTADGGADSKVQDEMDLMWLPKDYLLSFLFHDGQRHPSSHVPYFPSFLGGNSFYDMTANHLLNSCDDALEELHLMSGVFPSINSTDPQPSPQTAATSASYAPQSQASLFSILSPNRRVFPMTSNSSGDFMSFCITENGVVRLLDMRAHFYRQSPLRVHIIAPTFLEFLQGHAKALCNYYSFHPRDGLVRFPQPPFPASSDTVTRFIRIQACPLFVPELSMPMQIFYAYHIRITHTGSDDASATLQSRHWRIEEEDGHVETVSGAGVVGLFPKIERDGQLFTYESCSTLKRGLRAKMSGTFTFKVDGTENECIEARIATFILDPSICAV